MLIKDEIKKDVYDYSFLTWFYNNLQVRGSKDDYIYDCQVEIANHINNFKINEIYLRGGRQCGLTTFTLGLVTYNSIVSDEDMSIFLFSHKLEGAMNMLYIYKGLLDGCEEKIYIEKETKTEITFTNPQNYRINVQTLPMSTNSLRARDIKKGVFVFDNFEYSYSDFVKYKFNEKFIHCNKCNKYFISTSEHYVGDGTDFMNSAILHSTEEPGVFGYEIKSVRGIYKNDEGDVVEIKSERPDLVLSLFQQGYKYVGRSSEKDPDYTKKKNNNLWITIKVALRKGSAG